MSSKREQVVAAVTALIKAALPNADHTRNRDKPDDIGPGGQVNVDDGDPGQPEVDLSPLAYNYDHRIPVSIGAYESAGQTREQVLDDMLQAVGDAVEGNRQLGGLCTYLDVEAATGDEAEAFGSESARWADFAVIASYVTGNPLT